jgi:hypothetical protein
VPRTWRKLFPSGYAARAIRIVPGGNGLIAWGWSDIELLREAISNRFFFHFFTSLFLSCQFPAVSSGRNQLRSSGVARFQRMTFPKDWKFIIVVFYLLARIPERIHILSFVPKYDDFDG